VVALAGLQGCRARVEAAEASALTPGRNGSAALLTAAVFRRLAPLPALLLLSLLFVADAVGICATPSTFLSKFSTRACVREYASSKAKTHGGSRNERVSADQLCCKPISA
jgi:hypothetical protein